MIYEYLINIRVEDNKTIIFFDWNENDIDNLLMNIFINDLYKVNELWIDYYRLDKNGEYEYACYSEKDIPQFDTFNEFVRFIQSLEDSFIAKLVFVINNINFYIFEQRVMEFTIKNEKSEDFKNNFCNIIQIGTGLENKKIKLIFKIAMENNDKIYALDAQFNIIKYYSNWDEQFKDRP